MVVKEEMVVVAKGKLLKSRLPRRSEKRKALDVKGAEERSTAIRAERVPTFSNPWGLLAITSTSGTGPKTFLFHMDVKWALGFCRLPLRSSPP
jgi:hypothetical protein